MKSLSGEGRKIVAPANWLAFPGFSAAFDRLNLAIREVDRLPPPPRGTDRIEVNPTLQLLDFPCKISPLLRDYSAPGSPEPKGEWAGVWKAPGSGETRVSTLSARELLALKLYAEGISINDAAAAGGIHPGKVHAAVLWTAEKGLLLAPRSRIRRDTSAWTGLDPSWKHPLEVKVFSLQWHITHACDLHCKHCYDRSRRSPLALDEGINLLEDFYGFCRERRVRGHVTFTGGNPFLHQHFSELYQAAADRGFSISILGNPTAPEKLETLVRIQNPDYFQLSLEGLPPHNDEIRGKGHFGKTIKFLSILEEFGIPSGVMLTLTADNMEQIIPLAERLRGKTNSLTFNRLSPVGEGADLLLPSPDEYSFFLERYVDCSLRNPIAKYKDNLINIILRQRDLPLFSGCTGYGCGAAFNFLSVLPDGETHACRKFPSLLGNILNRGFARVYDSSLARRYRNGAQACAGCSLRAECGGCLAIAQNRGLDIFRDRDPFCFIGDYKQPSTTEDGGIN